MKKLLIILFFLPAFLMAQRGRLDLSNIAVKPTVPSISITPTFVNNFSNVTGTASAAQTVTVSWFNLTTNVSVNALANFEYSYDGTTYFSSLSISKGSGSGDTLVYIRGTAAAATGTHTGSIPFSSTPATTIYLSVTCVVSASGSATLTRSPTSISLGTTVVNTPGSPVSVTVTGSNLSNNVGITAGAGTDVSCDGTTFGSSCTLTQSGGSLNTSFSARLSSAASPSNPSGSITIASSPATSVFVTYSGSVVNVPPPGGLDTVVAQINFNQTAQKVSDWVDFTGNPNCFTDSTQTDDRFRDSVSVTIVPSRWGGGGTVDGCGPHASSNSIGMSSSTVVPANVGVSMFFNFQTTWAGTSITDTNMIISGLDPTQLYSVWIYAADGSTITCPGGRLMTVYCFDSTNYRVEVDSNFNVKQNLSDSIFFKNKKPDANGNIRLAITPKAGGNSGNCSQYGEINALRVTKQGTRMGFGWLLVAGLALGLLRRKKSILIGLLTLSSLFSFGQTESHDFVTYDTVVHFSGSNQPIWTYRITRMRNMFTPGNADTASRPVIFWMPGIGEIGTDTAFLTKYGPHHYMNLGWDGGVQLGNGKHYPIIISIITSATNVRPGYTKQIIDSIRHWYHIKWNSMYFLGYSVGGFAWGRLLVNSSDGVETSCMAMMKAFVALSGNAADNFNGVSFGVNAYRKWVNLYDGRYFGTSGTADNTGSPWVQRDSMVAAGSSKAYYTTESIGGGTHASAWEGSDPNITDWRNIPVITNTSVIANNTNHPNSIGNYKYGNVYQWMLQQGDSSLVGGDAPNVDAGAAQTINLPTSTATLTATASGNNGHTIASYAWSKVSGPSGGAITSPSSASTGITGLIAGVYIYQVLVTDNASNTNADNVQITVVALTPPSVSAGGNQSVTLPSNSITLAGSASGNGGATISSTAWTKISGPNTPTIVSPTSLTTVVSGMIQGTYVFRLTATDNNGNTNYDQATILVLNAGSISHSYPLFGRGEYQWVVIKADRKLYGISGNGDLHNIGLAGGTVGIVNKIVDSAMFVDCASGLHFAGAVDTSGYVWTMGDITNGQGGNGTSSPGGYNTPTKLLIDSAGNPMQPVDHLMAYFMGNAAAGWWAYKEGQTYGYVWGSTLYGPRGDGSNGLSTSNRPVPMTLPVAAKKIVCAYHCILMGTDGSVWTTGGGGASGHGQYENLGYKPTSSADSATAYLTWRKIAIAGSAIDIAGGMQWDYYLKPDHITLMGWGQFGGYMGAANNSTKYGVPTDLTANISSKLPAPIAQIVTDHTSTGVLCTDGTYWKWGDNPFGLIGNGQELDFGSLTPPWAYSLNSYLKPVRFPYKVLDGIEHIFPASPAFVMYDITIDSNGVTRSWGRAKASVLNNGIKSASSNLESDYPQWADVTLPTVMDLSSTGTWKTTCQLCLTYPDSLHCPQYTIPANFAPVVNAGPTQNISTETTTLDGSGSTDNVHISYYQWTQISGPATATIKYTQDAVTNVSGLTQSGAYVFQLKCTDNGWLSSTGTITVNVGASPATPCNCIITTNKKFQP